MYQRALLGYEKALGAEHSSTVQAVGNLGILYKNWGKFTEAEQMFQRALQGFERVLDTDHTSTLLTMNKLGSLYQKQGKLAEAEQMYQRVLQGYEKVLGTDHTSTVDTAYYLGNLYKDQGKLAESEPMFQQALQGYEKVLGPNHMLTLNIANILGELYLDQGMLDEAEKIYQRLLQSYENSCNLEHASARNALAQLYEIYRQHFVSLRQEQSPGNLNQDERARGTIIALADLCKKFGAAWPYFFSILGRILIWAGEDDDAVFAFQYQFRLAELKPKQGTACDGCEKWLSAGMGRFVCKACVDIDLCDECYKNYDMDGFSLHESCQAHLFLIIPGEEKRTLDSGSNSPDVSAMQWLTTIRAKH
jgi:tetratricopeptide (TPR) repeat protein